MLVCNHWDFTLCTCTIQRACKLTLTDSWMTVNLSYLYLKMSRLSNTESSKTCPSRFRVWAFSSSRRAEYVLQTSVTLELRRCCSHDIYASKPRNMKYVQEFGFKLMSAHILPTRQCTIKGQQTTRNFSKTCTELRSKLLLCSYRWAKKINSASNENMLDLRLEVWTSG